MINPIKIITIIIKEEPIHKFISLQQQKHYKGSIGYIIIAVNRVYHTSVCISFSTQ